MTISRHTYLPTKPYTDQSRTGQSRSANSHLGQSRTGQSRSANSHPGQYPATKPQGTTSPSLKPLLVGGLMFALIGIVFQLGGAKTLFNSQILSAKSLSRDRTSTTLAKSCETPINETSRLSRQQLLELLAVPERDSKSKVTQIVKEPYCQLSSLKIRAGVDAQRDAYPLEFDPQTTLVILYENDEYAGYRFKP